MTADRGDHGLVTGVADGDGAVADDAGPAAPRSGAGGVSTWPARGLVLLVRCWQLVVSPWYPPTCRFYPSCSAYAVRALVEHGALGGSVLTVRRLLRCHPWNPGGVDHVPPRAAPHRAGPGPSRGRPAA